jgi:two-component system, response regulator YesN
VDSEGRELWSLGGCGLCRVLSSSPRRKTVCRGHNRTAVQESLRWGEPYISVCPFGLITFAVPILPGGRLSAGLVSGFAILPQMQEDIRQEVLGRIRGQGVRLRAGRSGRLPLRVVSSEQLRSSASLLFDLASRAGMNDPSLMRESREKTIQQFTIANYLADAREGKHDLVASLVKMQSEIIEKVVLGDLSGSREIVNRFLGVIFLESSMNFDMLKVRLLEFIVIISRAAIEKGISAEGLLGPRYSYLTDLNSATGFDELCWKVTKILENFNTAVSEEMRRKGWAHLAKMKDYVNRNFTSRITAEAVAAAAELSVSRAQHLFRQESGTTLAGYVMQRRIAYAKYLLRTTADNIAEIATECGFFDQSHFTRTFGRLEGLSPLKYRTRSTQGGGQGRS